MGFDDLATDALEKARDHLGSPIVYRHVAHSVDKSIDGIWAAPFQTVSVNGDVEINTSAPTVGVVLADLDYPPDEGHDEVIYRGITYLVRETQPDGQGGAVLLLRRK